MRTVNVEKEDLIPMEPRFGYTCQECGKGKVIKRVFDQYQTRIQGVDFTVPNAIVGVCDVCGAEHFSGPETERWYELFDQSRKNLFLSPEDIRQIRESLGLTMEQFAQLSGSTRQSIYNWERRDRTFNQSRMADLLLRLIGLSREVGKVNVIEFLTREAHEFGHRLGISAEAGRTMGPANPAVAMAKEKPARYTSADRHKASGSRRKSPSGSRTRV